MDRLTIPPTRLFKIHPISFRILTTVLLLKSCRPIAKQRNYLSPIRKFTRDYCCAFNMKTFATPEPYDVVRIWWKSRPMRLVRAFHWALMLPNDKIFHFLPFNDTHGTASIERVEYYRGVYSAGPNPRQKPLLALHETLALIHRLVGMEFIYNQIYCNCRHFVDYVMYGTTFGRRWNSDLSDWRISKSCPLHRILERGIDFDDDDFYLEDGERNKYKLNPIPN